MEGEECANPASDTTGKIALKHDDVPDPEEDDLDELDGML